MSKNTQRGSERSSTEPISRSSAKDYLDSFRQSILKRSTLPPLESYRTSSESVGAMGQVAEKAAPRKGLFESLIGDPRVLFYDLLDAPDSFEPGTAELLQELISGKPQESLTKEQASLLDRATLVYASVKKPKPTKGLESRGMPEAAKMASRDEEDEPEVTIPELPTGPTFWWRS
jgi:hypothetical protein